MRFETGTIELNLGNKKFDATYEKKVYESMDDIVKEAAEGEKSVALILKKINQGEDWERRTDARKNFLNNDESAGRAKAFEDQVKAYISAREKAGKPVSDAQARAKVTAMMED